MEDTISGECRTGKSSALSIIAEAAAVTMSNMVTGSNPPATMISIEETNSCLCIYAVSIVGSALRLIPTVVALVSSMITAAVAVQQIHMAARWLLVLAG